MHHLDRLTDVEAAPVTTPEGIAAGHLAHEFAQAEIAVLELDLLHLVLFTGVTGVAEHLHVHSPDHGLGAGFGVADAGLAAAAGNGVAAGGDLLQAHHLRPELAGSGGAELRAVHLARLAHAVAHQDPAAVVADRCRPGAHIGGSRGEDCAVVQAQRIVATAIGVLIGVGLAIAGVEGDVLGGTLKWSAEAEQLAVGTPASALLSFFADVAQVGNGFFPEHLGVLHAVDQRIHQPLEALGGDDVEVARELLAGADATAKEVAEGQLHHTAIHKPAVELLLVFLAVAQGADELPH